MEKQKQNVQNCIYKRRKKGKKKEVGIKYLLYFLEKC